MSDTPSTPSVVFTVHAGFDGQVGEALGRVELDGRRSPGPEMAALLRQLADVMDGSVSLADLL